MKTLVICSGGLDSVTLAYKVAKARTLTRLVGFDYGQRHKKELEFAQSCAQDLNVPFSLIDISAAGRALTGSALTDNVDVPDGHYAADNMATTIVPNRNAIMLTIAYGIAMSNGDEAVGTAIHAGDHFIYPDCRPAFAQSFAAMQNYALEGVAQIDLYTPFLGLSKADIVTEAYKHNVPFMKTWSCYKGGEQHCGCCGTCVERAEAFYLAGVEDPTAYADISYWKRAVAEHKGAA